MNGGLLGRPGPTSSSSALVTGVPTDTQQTKYLNLKLTGVMDRARGVYLPAAYTSPLPNLRDGLARASAGTGVCRILCRGDSITYGSYASNLSSKTWPGRFAAALAAKTGLPFTYGQAKVDTSDARFALSGTWSLSANTYVSTTANDTITYTSTDAGDRVVVGYWPATTGSFTIAVDGGTATTVSFTNNVTQGAFSVVTGQTNAVHTVVVKVVSGQVNIANIGIERTGGIAVTRLGIPGEATPYGLNTSYSFPNDSHTMFLSAGAIGFAAPDLLIDIHGTNDVFFGTVQPQTTQAGHVEFRDQIVSRSAKTDLLFATPIPNGTPASLLRWAAGDTDAGIYAAAEIVNCPVVDLRALWGSFSLRNAQGMYYTDSTHLTDAGYQRLGNDMAGAVGSLL